GDEMNLMPPPRELEAELGGHGARPAVGRIAGDADLHAVPVSRVARRRVQASATSAASRSGGRVASSINRWPGSWCRNQVSCRLAYCRVLTAIASATLSRVRRPIR